MAAVKLEQQHTQSVEPLQIKEEPSPIKEEPEEFPFHVVTVKTEDDEDKSSVLHQRPTEENREETNGQDCGAGCSSDPLTQLHSDSSDHTDHTEDWTPEQTKPRRSKGPHLSSDSEEKTDDSEDYSQEPVPAKRSYAMIPPDSCVTDHRPFSCSDCGKSFQWKSHLQKHMLVHSGEKPHKCSFCDKSFKDKCNLRHHVKTHTGENTFNCSVCKKDFKRKDTFVSHVRTHTGEKPFRCSVCKRGFNQKSNLQKHMKTYSQQKPFVCSVCGKGFILKYRLTRHLKLKHQTCVLCKTHFKDVNKLKDHLKSHVEEGTLDPSILEGENKPFRCSECGKRFGCQAEIKSHRFVHTGQSPFICTVCEKGFIKKYSFIEHLKRIHRVCPICKIHFTDKASLTEHLSSHGDCGTSGQSSLRSFSCAECGKVFISKSYLKNHMLVHTGEKSFKCSVCEKAFRVNRQLKYHMSIHTGEKPFICTVCGKCFARGCSKKRHERSHTVEGEGSSGTRAGDGSV